MGEGSPSAQGARNAPFHIEVQDGRGVRIAGPEIQAAPPEKASAVLVLEREYQPGDRIMFGGPQRMVVRLDEHMPECILYLAGPAPGSASYEIPYGVEEKQTGSAYARESFAGKNHRIEVRALNKHELSGYRNLALNPCDLRETEQVPPQIS